MTIEELVNICPDIQFMPILENKLPVHKGWQKTKTQYDYSGYNHYGIVCGELSGGIEVIDIDLKYDLTGDLYKRLKKAINAADPELLKKLVVQKTKSGGYHFIFRCSKIEGNKKLARRPATDDEKKAGEKIKVLLETRGEGGYIVCWPTPGYEMVFGSFDKIHTLTPEERETLFTTARQFNEYFEEFKPAVRTEKKKLKGLTPFEDYDNRGDVIGLLESHGWKISGQKGNKILLLRPGDSKARHSGNFDEDKNWFSVFSTSTQFKEETAYRPYAVYAVLECDGDYSLASKKLYDEGFGDRIEKAFEERSVVKSRIDTTVNDLSFLATEKDYSEYITNWRNGTFKLGLTTGFPEFDKYFRFKESNLVVINGHDNVGKSVVIWYFALLSAMLHGWRWLLFSSENSVGSVIRKLIEFYWCMEIKDMPEDKYQIAHAFIRKHFDVIISDDELYNYKDILNMTKITMNVKGVYNGLLIDPYNSLKIDLPPSSKLSVHDYHYEALSDIKLFGKRNNIAIYVNCHVVTESLRMVDKDGYPLPPKKSDSEQGGKFGNKADDFMTIHRLTQHPVDWDVTEIHIRKIKETETGGKVSPLTEPFKIRKIGNVVGFKFETFTGSFNPIERYHQVNNPVVVKVEPQITERSNWFDLPPLPPAVTDESDIVPF
jgi:hypothetical protein